MSDAQEERRQIQSSPWLLFPWSLSSLGRTGPSTGTAALGASDPWSGWDDESSVHVDPLSLAADTDPTSLTQFPPYGRGQQRAAPQPTDLPPDWINHLSQLSALATLSELEAAAALSSPRTDTTPSGTLQTPDAPRLRRHEQVSQPQLSYEWEPSERTLWCHDLGEPLAPAPHRTGQDAGTRESSSALSSVPATESSSWRARRRARQDRARRDDHNHSCHDAERASPWRSRTAPPDAPATTPTNSSTEAPQNASHAVQSPRVKESITTTTTTTTDPTPRSNPPTDLRRQGNIHLGQTAAHHLELVARHLLASHAPRLGHTDSRQQSTWVHTLLGLATRVVARVDPRVKERGDLLDIAPLVKIKTIAGGKRDGSDCAYLSGVMFRRTMAQKGMPANIAQPRILLLQGGLEFYEPTLAALLASTNGASAGVVSGRRLMGSKPLVGRSGGTAAAAAVATTGSRRGDLQGSTAVGASMASYAASNMVADHPPAVLSSLDTFMEHEETFLDRLVSRLLQIFQPDVIVTGGTVCRRAMELLSKANVTVISHVKPKLLQRIARQTQGHILTAEGIQKVLVSTDGDAELVAMEEMMVGRCHRFRLVTFRDNELWTDGHSSDQSHKAEGGLAVRSINALLSDPDVRDHDRQAALVAKQLGQDVVDGSEAVKSGLAKRGVAQMFVMLEGCPQHLGCTVVLRGVDKAALKQVKTVFRFLVNIAYNLRLETNYFRDRGARIRPDFQVADGHAYSSSLCVDYGRPPAGKKSRPWNGSNAQRIPRSETGEVTAFDHQAILITSVWMTQQSQCCPAEVKGICYYSIQDVALGQFLRDSCFNLSLKCQNPNCKKSVLDHSLSFVHNDGLVSITVEELGDDHPLSDQLASLEGNIRPQDKAKASNDIDRPIFTWSFCKHCKKIVSPVRNISGDTWKYSFGKFLETTFYNRDAIFNSPENNCACGLQLAASLYFGCGKLAAQFNFEPIRPFAVFVRRTLPMDSSFQKDEGLRRLQIIADASSKLFVSFDKHIDKISRETRSLFNSPSVRPEHLQTVLSELNKLSSFVDDAAKSLQDKIASVSDSIRKHNSGEQVNAALLSFPWFARRYLFVLTSAWNEKLTAAGQAISTMKKLASSANGRDGAIAANTTLAAGDPLYDELMESMKQLRKLNEHYTRYSMVDISQALPPLIENNSEVQQDGDFDDDFEREDTAAIDYTDGVDADVVASRRRLQARQASGPESQSSRSRPVKSLGTRRSEPLVPDVEDPQNVVPKPTPGGAVKSALNRFFNRRGRDQDLYSVDLGVFAEGRPRLAPGLNGVVVPLYDDQLSTIIAYSLSSAEYAKQFKYYSRHESPAASDASSPPETTTENPPLDPNGLPSHLRSSVADESNQKRDVQQPASAPSQNTRPASQWKTETIEQRMLVRSKSHVKHTFRDFDEKGQPTCKFVCTTYWATQFHAVRQVFLSASKHSSAAKNEDKESDDFEQSYIESLSSAYSWAASGGKSGASFHRTSDDRFVIKFISSTELQMFLDCAPAYFEYLSKAFFHGLPTVLCKIVGVYQIGIHNRVTGKRTKEQVAVMQNIFYNRKIARVFDLKGSLRGRFAAQLHRNKDEGQSETASAPAAEPPLSQSNRASAEKESINESTTDPVPIPEEENHLDSKGLPTLLDGDFLEWTGGRPVPLTDRAKAVFQMSILNDTLFLSIINVLDYSILVGIDEDNQELVVGIIDFMRQYDILKQMERVGKSLPMVVGSEAPTIIQPPLYKARFSNAMERYFMGIPNKWTTI